MLLLLFRAMDHRFAIKASQVIEVIPRVDLLTIPHAPAFFAGLLNYRGRVLPVVDFSVLIGSDRSRDALSTRIVVVNLSKATGESDAIGLIAQDVSHLQDVVPKQKRMAAAKMETAPYLGAVYEVGDGLVQIVVVEHILHESLKTAFLPTPANAIEEAHPQ